VRDDTCIRYDDPDGENTLKIRHILFALLAVLAIAFMQPLITFLGGLTLLIGVGTFIFRDLSAVGQDAVERWVLGWLRRMRSGPATAIEPPATLRHRLPTTSVDPVISTERIRRNRDKTTPPAGI